MAQTKDDLNQFDAAAEDNALSPKGHDDYDAKVAELGLGEYIEEVDERGFEDRRNKSTVRESGRISELKCLERSWICGNAAESQAGPGQSLKRLEGDLASWLLMIQGLCSTCVKKRRIGSQR